MQPTASRESAAILQLPRAALAATGAGIKATAAGQAVATDARSATRLDAF